MSDEENYSGDEQEAVYHDDSPKTMSLIEGFSTGSQQAISKIVRTIIALNNNKITINADNIKKAAWNESARLSEVKFKEAFETARLFLDSCLGYKLVDLPAKLSSTAKSPKASSSKTYMLISNIEDEHARFIIESKAQEQGHRLFASELNHERKDYRNDKDLNPTFNSDEKLMNNGVILLILSIIILSENSIMEEELTRIFKDIYGIGEVTKFPIAEINILEFLKILDKQEYVHRKVTRGSTSDQEVVEYMLGRRAKAEFDRDSFISFARIIMDEAEDNQRFLTIVQNSIKAAYDA
ncbi:hypothetical protein WICPIJ_007108 [Wickerhamomyces pijperi]|uniref:MAGE domain-containing protein n=1 Tax=Wickerhamomyces pijperi TaxID=599730 RepID=A0A9P8Q2G9_WICPI|nr:hypothetical protein WICPIJ_007108 [Wickerhamomyces pijperi]